MLHMLFFLRILCVLWCVSVVQSAQDSEFDGIETADVGFKTSFTNLGQGNGTIAIDNVTGRRIFIDSGSSKRPIDPNTGDNGIVWDNLRPCLTLFPDALETQPLTVICSHADKDHLNQFKSFISELKVRLDKNPMVLFYLGGSFEKYLCSEDSLEFFKSILTLNDPKIISLSHALTVLDMVELARFAEQKKSVLAPADGYESVEKGLVREIRLKLKEHSIRPFILRSNLKAFSDDGGRSVTEILCANAGHSTPHNYATINNFEDDVPSYRSEIIDYDENMNSIVMRLTFYNAFSIIITGDATGVTTDRLIQHFPVESSPTNTLLCDILLACHHGSITEESNNKEWVEITQPQYVIFSAGKHEGYHHPQFDSLFNYSNSPRLAKSVPDHSVLCARNKDNRGRFREIRPSSYPFITSYKQLDDNWHNLKTQHGLYSTHSSGRIIFDIAMNSHVITPALSLERH